MKKILLLFFLLSMTFLLPPQSSRGELSKREKIKRYRLLMAGLKKSSPYEVSEAITKFGAPLSLRETRFLYSKLNNKNKLIRQALIEVIAKTKDDKSRKWLTTKGLKTQNKTVFLALLKIFAKGKIRKALPPLIKILKSKDKEIAFEAVYALSEMPDKRSVMPLIRLMKNTEDKGHRFILSRALTKIIGRNFGLNPEGWAIYWQGYRKSLKIGKVHDPCAEDKKDSGKGKRRTILRTSGYSQRFGSAKIKLLKKYGGNRTTEAAVFRGLDWLKRHQSPNGRWDGDGFQKFCKRSKCSHKGKGQFDVALTGLALLSYLGAGYTHLQGKFKKTVWKGLKWLKKKQNKKGAFSGNMYNHGLAAFAVAEAYLVTRDCRIRDMLQKAIDFICKAQKPHSAWRYRPRPATADTSVSGWQIMALASANLAPDIKIPIKHLIWAGKFLDRVTDKKTSHKATARRRKGFVHYKFGPPKEKEGKKKKKKKKKHKKSDFKPRGGSPATTAVGAYCRLLLGESNKSDLVQAGVNFLSRKTPKKLAPSRPGHGGQNRYYWYYGTLLFFQAGGKHWKQWNKEMSELLLKDQVKSGCHRGSFPPDRKWGEAGGRIYSTAISILMLEVYYRYERK